jgi:hypothetical protein
MRRTGDRARRDPIKPGKIVRSTSLDPGRAARLHDSPLCENEQVDPQFNYIFLSGFKAGT